MVIKTFLIIILSVNYFQAKSIHADDISENLKKVQTERPKVEGSYTCSSAIERLKKAPLNWQMRMEFDEVWDDIDF